MIFDLLNEVLRFWLTPGKSVKDISLTSELNIILSTNTVSNAILLKSLKWNAVNIFFLQIFISHGLVEALVQASIETAFIFLYCVDCSQTNWAYNFKFLLHESTFSEEKGRKWVDQIVMETLLVWN